MSPANLTQGLSAALRKLDGDVSIKWPRAESFPGPRVDGDATLNVESVRERIERIESESLVAGAAFSAESRGRRIDEEPHPVRTAFMRDRDRILHCKAFRRLAHKTQVFVAPEGDHHRVRLTHTLEVAQIARTLARALRLNEDLAEAICLGHDLGHTPFGHLGEEALSEFLGYQFRHNQQSLRVVDELEIGTHGPGLNLTWEVRDGILNHTWSMPPPSTLEAGIARYADRIAYLSHDIDDAIRAGVLKPGDLPPETNRVFGPTPSSRIDVMVGSVVESSLGQPKVGIGADVLEVMNLTREFMFAKVYNRPELREEQMRLKKVLSQLLEHYGSHPQEFGAGGDPGGGSGGFAGPQSEPGDAEPANPPEEKAVEQRLIDYVAGMTDRFALRRHRLIFEGTNA